MICEVIDLDVKSMPKTGGHVFGIEDSKQWLLFAWIAVNHFKFHLCNITKGSNVDLYSRETPKICITRVESYIMAASMLPLQPRKWHHAGSCHQCFTTVT